mmetsp:Transcript_56562/g.64826  ORF Transcript_56562/g.64826 Transcript_56562/m.64826 type:complete len:425 (+) Transcript_56562:26-1300(+)
MKSAFECSTLETIKRNLNADSSKKFAAFYDTSSIKEFLVFASEETKEKIFSISNPSIFFEILNPLIELNSLYTTEKLPGSGMLLYKLKDSSNPNFITTVSMQSLIMLCDVIDDPELQVLLSCFVFLEKKVTAKSIIQSLNQPCLDSKNVIANPEKFFQDYDKVLKVLSQNYLHVFDVYQTLLENFSKGFKYICKKQNEEAFFFEVAKYFLETFPRETTIEEVFVNRIYANILAFGCVLENRILSAFERNKINSKINLGTDLSKKKSSKLSKDKAETSENIHIGRLRFRVVENSFELNEYEDCTERINNLCSELEQSEFIKDIEVIKVSGVNLPEALEVRKNVSDTTNLSITKDLLIKRRDSLSVVSASTSESSVDSECLKAKRKHRKRRRRAKRKNLTKQTPEDYLRHPSAMNFQNWIYGISLR